MAYRVTNSYKYLSISLKSNVWLVSSPHDDLDDPDPFHCIGSGFLLSLPCDDEYLGCVA
tara:strand:- start:321 stop:497 length:177 start_codon:yes stop_codon:yes gene_type:complete